MASKSLQKIRDFEKKYLPYTVSQQPRFHVTGGIGWINDPNGFSLYKGEYHLFFQYYPYDTKWGPMHWGHVKTHDFIKWERLPAAIAPDTEYDRDGCFSGSAVETPDGKHLLMYTGVRNVRRHNGMIESFQTQCIALGDGVDYRKYERNPVIEADIIPKGNSSEDFRDPKIWLDGDTYYAVVGNRAADKSGNVLLFRSRNAIDWEFVSVLSACHNQYGTMWECPDFFELEGKHVLLISPTEMPAIGLEFHPGNSSLCIIGKLDEKYQLERENIQAIEYGLDFYAPQTVLTEDGRRVMIAWMQNWETSSCKRPELRFQGQMTVPRELSIRNGRLCQNPVRELEKYRCNKTEYHNVPINGATTLTGVSGRCIDMTVTVRPGAESGIYKKFSIEVAGDGENFTMISYRPETGTVTVDRTYSGFPHDIVNVREFPVSTKNGTIKIRVVMDIYSVEVFVNDGEQAASSTVYTDLKADAIRFISEGSTLIDVEKYDLEI